MVLKATRGQFIGKGELRGSEVTGRVWEELWLQGHWDVAGRSGRGEKSDQLLLWRVKKSCGVWNFYFIRGDRRETIALWNLFTYQTNCLFNCMATGVNATQSRDEVFTLTIYIWVAASTDWVWWMVGKSRENRANKNRQIIFFLFHADVTSGSRCCFGESEEMGGTCI